MKSSKTTKPGNSQTIYRKLSDLKKLPNNPRIIKDDDFKKLVKSIEGNPDYFEARPVILSDRTGELIIIAGNQRYEAAKQLKLKEIPTFLISGLTEEREKEIIIRGQFQKEKHGVKQEKKIGLPAIFIEHFTVKNEIVIDFFGGAGSTMAASEQLNRICYMIEKEPKHCQIILDRMKKCYNLDSNKI